ncbi:DUF6567 family protein [Flavobacterium sp. 7A]|uniref:DUF6567 family protein n=1 Tax=Flavobacterium sp. 7A TaxID=2940571 RepID=UPI0022279F7B|nr:DUF6567 family protein [Flavobacterium sp. 7A]MCW2119611.1 hypothetical protein [Flavobacterium sp. 7A]
MKKILCLLSMSLVLTITSCGGSASVMSNSNSNQTNVELSKKNFNVIGTASGVSTNTYIFGIGGSSNRALLEKAKSEMIKNANLTGPKAIVNVTYDKHFNGFFPFYSQVTVTASANIVEFTE